MREMDAMLRELDQHEPSFEVVTEARRRASERASRAPSRWRGRAKRGVGLAVAGIVAAGVLIILAVAAHSRSAAPPARSPNGGPNTPRQELVADAQLLSASLASQVASAQRFHPPDPRQVVADPEWVAHARADLKTVSRHDPLYPLFRQISTAQRLARAGHIAQARRLILPAANQARLYAIDHPSQSPLQPPAWAVRFFAVHELPHIASIERFLRHHRHQGGYSDLAWPAYGYADVQMPQVSSGPRYTHPLSWLQPGTRWHTINQLHLQIWSLLESANQDNALPFLKRLDGEIRQALSAVQ